MVVERMHQSEEADEPVTRRECWLHRELIDRRVGSVERDIIEMKGDLRSMKDSLQTFYDAQESRWAKLYVYVIVILILVAAGRVFDIDKILGLL
jgi:hypothetical protein